jgi:small subunit ribosomal protein S7
MTRKNKDYKRDIKIELKYGNLHITQFINKLMQGGKKSTAEKIVYNALDILAQKTNEKPDGAFEKALKNVTPLMEVKSRRVGGSTYQVPIEVRKDRGVTLAMRWLVRNSRSRSGRTMVDKLSSELVDAYNCTGTSIKKREDTHKMAESNKAFAHFRW